MRRIVIAGALLVLAGCSSGGSEPDAGSSGTVAVPTVTASAIPSQQETSPVPAQSTQPAEKPSTPAAKPSATGNSDASFCDYLAQTAGAQQQVEDPAEFVKLVQGAQAVAPGAIADDLALYVQSVKKLAVTVTGTPEEAAQADAWLSRNEAAVAQAEANVNSYSESTCGTPFIGGVE